MHKKVCFLETASNVDALPGATMDLVPRGFGRVMVITPDVRGTRPC